MYVELTTPRIAVWNDFLVKQRIKLELEMLGGFGKVEEFTNNLIEEDEFDADQKDAFKNFVKDNVQEAKKANRQAREARKKALQK
ncbi:hypothetical protein VitviT2T_023002 [Vitis vinifera]|uniref:Uncharacterized protein n=1 Tax=Vitis vinifera TaxID=29760 RepID=A0ABY9DBG9_VITVI|nr:hypothetical protein VitviT2T_023002 [Vitis vinifera]